MSEHEILNYIKYTLEDLNQARQLWKILNDKSAYVAASIIQKIALRSKATVLDIQDDHNYKSMLRTVANDVATLNIKQVIDTFFAVSRVHLGQNELNNHL